MYTITDPPQLSHGDCQRFTAEQVSSHLCSEFSVVNAIPDPKSRGNIIQHLSVKPRNNFSHFNKITSHSSSQESIGPVSPLIPRNKLVNFHYTPWITYISFIWMEIRTVHNIPDTVSSGPCMIVQCYN